MPELTTTQRIDEVERSMDNLRSLVQKNNADTEEVLEIVRMGKGFFKVLGFIGRGVGWLIATGVSIGGLWYTITHGGTPK